MVDLNHSTVASSLNNDYKYIWTGLNNEKCDLIATICRLLDWLFWSTFSLSVDIFPILW